ncbi:MAG: 1,4-dihydroxy-2-naphthoateoctaprenyltransferase [Cryptosporangiaceae bacterium]|nr:1,4-dihydroxy-2-naphthoateoctaprenyltransferase [Cryptosporangiaceae bacterium]
MATAGQWVEGARPRTLPAALSPVAAGTGAAVALGGFSWWRALLALVVALALQIAVNYANDYSDGIRGTDTDRVGPLRLTGSGVATPGAVKAAAFASFGVGAAAGLVLVVSIGAWWLLAVGALCILAAWYYTGGSRPYGYQGLGEISVFVFFGLVAVLGTVYVQAGRVSWAAVAAAVGVGAYACALLVANNLRDIPTDVLAGKRTLAVLLGDRRTRALWFVLVGGAQLLGLVAALDRPWALLSLAGMPIAVRAGARLVRGARGRDLVPVLRDTGLAELLFAVGLGMGLAL